MCVCSFELIQQVSQTGPHNYNYNVRNNAISRLHVALHLSYSVWHTLHYHVTGAHLRISSFWCLDCKWMWHIEDHLQCTSIITSGANGPSEINVATLSQNCRGVNSKNIFRNHFSCYFTYLSCSIHYFSVSITSWWQWSYVHHATQHLTFTMPCYSLYALKSCHFYILTP